MTELEQFVALDIDQTLNDPQDLVRVHLLFYNENLGLGMSYEDIVKAARAYKKTFDVPQIQAYRETNEKTFQEAREAVRSSLESNMEFVVNPGAVKGVKQLYTASNHNLGYFTVRPQVRGMQETTEKWLKMQSFPKTEATVVCTDPKDKIDQVLRVADEYMLPAMLIDDSLSGLLQASATYAPHALIGKLTLVGFGMNTQQAQSLRSEARVSNELGVVGLESWEPSLVRTLIAQFAA